MEASEGPVLEALTGRVAECPPEFLMGPEGLVVEAVLSDLFMDLGGRAIQEESFRRHIQLAVRVGKPLVVHDRDAHDDVVDSLQ